MSYEKITSKTVFLFGYVLVGLAVVHFITDHVARFEFSRPFDLGVLLANLDLAAIGVLASVISICLKNLEGRVSRIESHQPSKADRKPREDNPR